MTPAHFWCDGTWCWGEELEELLSFMSDDYATIEVIDEDDADRVSLEVLRGTQP